MPTCLLKQRQADRQLACLHLEGGFLDVAGYDRQFAPGDVAVGLSSDGQRHCRGFRAISSPYRITSYNVCYTKLLRAYLPTVAKEPKKPFVEREPPFLDPDHKTLFVV